MMLSRVELRMEFKERGTEEDWDAECVMLGRMGTGLLCNVGGGKKESSEAGICRILGSSGRGKGGDSDSSKSMRFAALGKECRDLSTGM